MKNVISEIRTNWVLIAFISGMIVWFANVNSRLANAEKQLESQNTILEKVSQIQQDVAYIKGQIGNLK